MNEGTYRTQTGEFVTVTQTPSGDYMIRYPDGRVTVVR